MMRPALLVVAIASAAATAVAQEGELLPLLPSGTVEAVPAEAPERANPAPGAQAEPEAPSPEETLDEAAEALVHLLTIDTPEGPPMAQCAIELLRSRLATAVEGDDVLTAIALENELLALCNRRQQLVLEVLSTELLLAAMIAGDDQQQEHQVIVIQPEPPPAPTLDQITTAPAAPEPEPPVAVEPPPPPPASPGLAWVTVLGSAGNLRAAVTDGASLWWVRLDTVLPDEWRVTRIAASPPGVTVYHPDAGHHALPFHAGPEPGTGEP